MWGIEITIIGLCGIIDVIDSPAALIIGVRKIDEHSMDHAY
jgi:hypothetical protein